MTSRKKILVSSFVSCVISAWPWCICPPTFAKIVPSNSELLTFSEIQDCGRHHLGFSSRVKFGTFHHVNSVMLELYIKFGSNICDSHWYQHTYAPDIYYAPAPVGEAGALSGHRRPSSVRPSVRPPVCLMSRTSALTRKPKGLGRRNFAHGYPRSHATPTPTSRSKGQKSRSRVN